MSFDGFGEIFGDVVEQIDDVEAPVFKSFDELKAVIETEPTIVSTALLIQAVQSRLQRSSPHVDMSDVEIDRTIAASKDIRCAHGPDAPKVHEQCLREQMQKERDQHEYLKTALVKLEARLQNSGIAS